MTFNTASTNPTQPLSLEEALHVLFLCFEAATNAFPQPIVAYAMPCRHRSGEKPIWQIWTIEDLATKPPRQMDDLPFLPPRLHKALSRKNMCSYFCWMMEQMVDRTLKNIFGATAKWMRFWPKIDFLLAWRSMSDEYRMPMHSVLVIDKGDGGALIIDGTLWQYLWAPSTWLLSPDLWEPKRLDRNRGQHGWVSQEFKLKAETASKTYEWGF